MTDQILVFQARDMQRDSEATFVYSMSVVKNDGIVRPCLVPAICQDTGTYEELRAKAHKMVDELFNVAGKTNEQNQSRPPF